MFWSVTLSLLEGLREVVKLFALTLVFSLPLGLAVTFGSMSKCRPVSWFFNVLVWIVRGTPLMLQLILIFYGPGIWLGHNIWGSQRMLACTVAFVLNYACYFSVIYRGGIEGVPAGQREAGEVLGLTPHAQHVGGTGALGGGYAIQLPESIHILLRPAQSGEDPVIEHGQILQIVIGGGDHSGAGHPQSGKKAHTQRNNGQNGQIPAQAGFDLPKSSFQQHILTTRSLPQG